MDFAAAIQAIKQSGAENAAELVSAIESHVSGLEAKSYEVIGENRKYSSKARTLQATVDAVAAVLGVNGEADAILSALEPAARELTTNLIGLQAKLTETEARASSAETTAKQLERRQKLSEIASLTQADPKVLEKLLADRIEEMQIDGTAVKLGEVELRAALEADADLKPFLPALFPAKAEPATPATPANRLPSTPPGGNTETSDPIESYMKRTYTGVKAFVVK